MSFTKFACEQARLEYHGAPSLLVVLAVRRCCFLLEWSHYQMLNWARPQCLQAESQLTESPGRAKAQTHKSAHAVRG